MKQASRVANTPRRASNSTQVDVTRRTARDALDQAKAAANQLHTTLRIKGSIDCSANPNYPQALQGDVYFVSVLGKIGGASGLPVDVNCFIVATADNAGGNQAPVGSSWDVLVPITYLDTDGTLAANSDTKLATQKAIRTYVANKITGLWSLQGSIDCSANPNYPAASKAYAWVVTVAGKIGGASGVSVDAGDVVIALADNPGGTQAAVGSSWDVIEHNLVGALLASNNLSDLANAATARANIGLGNVNNTSDAVVVQFASSTVTRA